MKDALLPPHFAELEPWASTWCLATEPERWAKRFQVSMRELQDFYDAFFPRAEHRSNLELVDSRRLGRGVVCLRYRVAR